MADLIAAALGWSVLIGAIAWVSLAVGRRAAAAGILVPLLVGLGLRLAVMALTHASSLSLGDHGIFYLDDETYRLRASTVAGFWRDGLLPDPARPDVVGSYQFGYELFLGVIFTLGTSSVLLGKLVNVVIGCVTIYVVARIAGQVLGERAKVRAAWIAALWPTMIWWSGTLMKESLAILLLALGILAAINLPRRGAVIGLAVLLPVLFLARGPAAIALMLGIAVGVAVAGRRAEGRWLSRALVTFGAATLCGVLAIVLVLSRGQPANLYSQYEVVIRNMIDLYQGNNPLRVPYDMVKSLGTPLPWVFDRATENWDRMLYPGVWLLLCALPLAVLGAWRLRKRPEAWLFLVTVATVLAINSFTSGFTFRQRSTLEPLILLLALAGTSSWQMATRWASAALGLTAVVAGVQSRSPLLAGGLLVCAGMLFLVARRLPADPFEPPPESPMIAAYAGGRGSRRDAVLGLAPAVWSAIAAAHGQIMRVAPPPADPPEATVAPGGLARLREIGPPVASAPPDGEEDRGPGGRK